MNFEISPDFQSLACEQYCTRVADGTHDSPKETSHGKLLVTSKNVKDGRLSLDSAYRISQEDFDSINKRSKVDQWDLLLTMIGTVGEICLITSSKPEFAIKNVGLLKCGDELKAKWLYYFLRSSQGQSLIEQRKKGSTQQYISLTEIRKLPVSFPTKSEVMAGIVDVLTSLDDRITLLRETNATLEAIAQALFKSWFVDFDPVRAKMEGRAPEGMDEATAALFPDSFEETELGAVPRGWRAATLADLTMKSGGGIQTGPFGSQLHASDYAEEGVPVVMPKDIKLRRVQTDAIARVPPADADRLARHKLEPGDIVFSRRGDVERHALISQAERGWLCGTGCLLVRPGRQWPSPNFLSLLLDAPQSRAWLVRHAVGATMPNLNTGILGSVPVVIPSNDLLASFEGIVSGLEERRAHNAEQAQTLSTLRDTLLPRLISGQLRLPEAQTAIEGALA